ncbi:hypothetical protein G6321_00035780 [Bradyrhizobium barranii subsp. barranii]|uniref:Uncharacterized protein n=1 Tax=Bradyrhizobium barranii subsp. barranii TaxID=2823807 RepID=A0A7Z0TUU1_9BRAD|nr:hypothetical protein [Bradyrhizobium barranii]UGX91135.1 hypothetical protein G6321_00035780 [Bradyrhizobium barranii subsp. barranii]
MIERQGDGFRSTKAVLPISATFGASGGSRRAVRSADHVKANTEMLQLRLMEKKRELVRLADVGELIDQIAGTVLTHLSSLRARSAPRGDLAIRCNIERVVFEVRVEIARVCQGDGRQVRRAATRRTVRTMLERRWQPAAMTACFREGCNLPMPLPKSN